MYPLTYLILKDWDVFEFKFTFWCSFFFFKDNDFIITSMQKWGRKVQGNLWSNIPIAAKIDPIYPNNTLGPVFHIEECILEVFSIDVQSKSIICRRWKSLY